MYEGDLTDGHRHGFGVLWCQAAEEQAAKAAASRKAYCGQWIAGQRDGSGVGGSFRFEIVDGDMSVEVPGRLGSSYRVLDGWQVCCTLPA